MPVSPGLGSIQATPHARRNGLPTVYSKHAHRGHFPGDLTQVLLTSVHKMANRLA